MEFYIHHGRLDPDGAPQQMAEDGTCTDIDDWGFDGPRLEGVIGFHCTYGVGGHWNLYFENTDAANKAEALTGWERWDDDSLTVAFSDDNTLLKLFDPTYKRFHYFGDWGIK